MKRIGLIGVTGYGARHLQLLLPQADAGQIELSAAVVINPEQAGEALAELRKRRVAVYSSTAEMYAAEAGKLDLAVIPAGISWHCPLTLEALSNGVGVLVEKPAAGSVADVEKMKEAERRAGLPVCVGFQHIYGEDVQALKRLLLSGRMGRVLRASVQGIWPRGDEYYARNAWAGRRLTKDGGFIRDSPANNALAHYLNLALFLCGETVECSAVPETVEGECLRCRPEIEMFDTCMFCAHLQGGTPLLVCLSHTGARAVDPEIRVITELGEVCWKVLGEWRATLASGETLMSGQTGQPQEKMYQDVLARLDNPKQFTCTLEIAEAHARAIELLDTALAIRQIRQQVRRKDNCYIIPGLEEIFADCVRTGRLPAASVME